MKLNKKIKKFILYFAIASLISVTSMSLYVFFPSKLNTFDNILRDYMFILRGPVPDSKNVTIVDLDDRSLQNLGQWPWPRNIVSDLIQNLSDAGAGVIGLDIVFPENDQTSPHTLIEKTKLNLQNIALDNYDEQLAITIANSPVILGYQFQFEDETYSLKQAPSIPAVFIEKNRDFEQEDYVLNASGTLLNIPVIQNNAYSSGFFNNVPDISGTIRSVPLIIRYDMQLYPSLALESLRAALGIQQVMINYDVNGVSNISLGEFQIPTDRHGRLLINYRGGEKSFKYISALDIINGTFDKSDIEGKVILIGTTAAGLQDLRVTPYDSVYPGVEVHANAIDNILSGEFLHKPSWADGANVIHVVFISFFLIFFLGYTKALQIVGIVAVFTAIDLYMLYYVLFTKGIVLNIFFPIFVIVLATLASLILDYLLETRQNTIIKNKFANKVSSKVMDNLLENEENTLSTVSKEVTIFFSDIRSFTNISESMPSAKALIDYLNRYMNPMTEIITKKEGTIDKYIGDAIMAYWNAPLNVKNHQDKALQAAIQQIEYLKILNKELEKENLHLIDIGIGLNCGEVVVGEMGSIIRSDYTIIGDPVNLGSRLESLCKGYGAKIIISEFVKEKLQEKYIIRDLDLVRVKGKKEPVNIYEVHTFDTNDTIYQEIEEFEKALYFYRDSRFEEALKELQVMLKKNLINKKVIELYIHRCEEFIKTPPKDFDGVFTYNTK